MRRGEGHKKRPAAFATGLQSLLFRGQSLPTAASVKTASAVESPTAMESSTGVTVKAATRSAFDVSWSPTYKAPTVVAGSAVKPTSPVITSPPIPAAAAVPRPRADEHAARKPRRPVITIRRTCIWVIPVVAISACRSRRHVGRSAYSNSNRPPLRMRVRRRYQAQPNDRQYPHVFHLRTPSESLKLSEVVPLIRLLS